MVVWWAVAASASVSERTERDGKRKEVLCGVHWNGTAQRLWCGGASKFQFQERP